MKGYTVVDAATVLSTHLTELLKNNMAELLSYGEVQKLLKELPKEQADLVKDLVPNLITVSGIQRVLQILLAERVSIRDLATILEGIADGIAGSRNPVTLTEHVRARSVAPTLCAVHRPGRLSAADRTFGEMGAGIRRVVDRSGRRSPTGDAALAPVGIHYAGARALRRSRARRRSAGAGDIVEHPAIRARHRRTFSGTDAGALAGRDPSPRPPEDSQQHLVWVSPAANRRQRAETAR